MPFRRSFDCLWCGRPYSTRDQDALEGWAQLCPDCVGRADENPFIRFRLHAALHERATGAPPTEVRRETNAATEGPPTEGSEMVAYYEARAAEYDEHGTHPADVIVKAHDLGLMNAHIPEEYGGLGLPGFEGMLIGEELTWGCAGVAVSIVANTSSSAMFVGDRRTSSANGALGRHERQDSAGMRLVTAASR